ncbi:alpha/beta-hydrolase [Tilletiaria anomala UBC 951]|uniref:Alpha/beta-hydrolase n=1 Tax=Tilletiaria anomala (strain ATCC 24038 / CBS 436.72 / UBC 951) TaxID=1037660 RepID=A0A066WQ25_TILAU|nr:alpha/beta-hydrolase [Tilletiaria anomala UBC 951]KDN53109.1 alpha/beta-hydrolase [Tilletiaria anomala UBC 951]
MSSPSSSRLASLPSTSIPGRTTVCLRNKGPPKVQIKLRIPYPSDGIDAGVELVGILARVEKEQPSGSSEAGSTSTATVPSISAASSSFEPRASTGNTQPARPIALILHGLFAHKDQLYHRALVDALDIDSFRFDFRGNDESSGEWRLGDMAANYRDLNMIVEYLRKNYNYWIEIIIAHSRGAGIAWEYFAKECGERTHPARRVPFLASMSARWYPPGILDLPRYANIGAEGRDWSAKVAGKSVTKHVTAADVMQAAKHAVQDYANSFPTTSEVLIVHGTRDDIVPTSAAAGFVNAVAKRGVRLRLHLIDGADHNYRGHFAEAVDAVCDWLCERRGAKSSPNTLTLESSWQSSVENNAAASKGRL